MSKYYEKAAKLRAIEDPHYNCAQSVVLPFAEDAGYDEKQVCAMAANFGGGMKRAATCGAVAAGLMVLGMYGVDAPAVIRDYYRRIKEKHEGHLECAELLRINKERGGQKKPHCDAMVYECVAAAEEILREQGKLDKPRALNQLMGKLAEAEKSVCEEGTISADDSEADECGF